jgi:hypothetical protein
MILKSSIPDPESRILNPESLIQNPSSRIASSRNLGQIILLPDYG